MERRATNGRIVRWTVVVGALAALTVPNGALSGQRLEMTRECECVDDQGQEIDSCTCFQTPDLAWPMATRAENRAIIGIGVGRRAPTDGREGVEVIDVRHGGAAEAAGLRQGDRIARINGRTLLEPLEDAEAEAELDPDLSLPSQRLIALLATIHPGEEVEIEYMRDGTRNTVTVTAERNPLLFMNGVKGWSGARPLESLAEGIPSGDEWPALHDEARQHLLLSIDPCFREWSTPTRGSVFDGRCVDGVDLVELNPDLAEYFGTQSGVLVTDVHEESTLGLRPGDVILSVDGREVTGLDHARRVLGSHELSEDITFRIVRRGDRMDVTGRRR